MVDRGLQPLCVFLAVFPGVFSVFIVGLRIWIRVKSKQYGIEDTLLAIASILNLVLSVTTLGYIFTSFYGYRFHNIPKDAINFTLAMKWNYANSCIYNPILALVKVSFLWTLLKLRSPNRWINCSLWATLVLNSCFAVAAPLACLLQCNPIPSYWDKTISGRCVDTGAYVVSTSSIVLGTDFLILIMPTWILHDLKMPLGRKLMVISFLSFGIAVTIVGAVRTSVLVKTFVLGQRSPDPTYQMSYILSNIESGLAIIGTCGPTFKHIFSFCIPALKTPDNLTDQRYTYPHRGGSQRDHVSNRDTKSAKTDSTPGASKKESFSELCCTSLDQLDGEIQMNHVTRSGRLREEPGVYNGKAIVITKTVAWHVDGAHTDSNSTCEQDINTPHQIL